MSEGKTGYKTAFKSTALFGGVQIATILISIVRSKLIAVWLGPLGFGMISIFNSVISLVSSVSNLGLSSSAARDISKAKAIEDDRISLAKTVDSINKAVIFTSLFGCFIMFVFSRLISYWTFDSPTHTLAFALMGIVVFFNGICSGQYATLQGTRELKLMAKSRILGALLGTALSLPFFYFLGESGIVYALIVTSVITYLVSYFYVKKIKLPEVKQNYKEIFESNKTTIRLGIMMMTSGTMVYFVEFIVKSFIARTGGLDDVGLYQAGWALNAQYLGLVFTAMATDYFPRLSQNEKDNKLMSKLVNEQAEIALLILGPLIAIMLVLLPFIVVVLYTKDFLSIIIMTNWLLIGSLIKAGAWAIGFVFLAKGDGKTYLINELGIKLITLPSFLLGYYFWGLPGIGYAFTSNYLVYFIWVSVVAYKKYKITSNFSFYKILFIYMFLLGLVVFVSSLSLINLKIVLLGSIAITTCLFSLIELNKRLDLKTFLSKKNDK